MQSSLRTNSGIFASYLLPFSGFTRNIIRAPSEHIPELSRDVVAAVFIDPPHLVRAQ